MARFVISDRVAFSIIIVICLIGLCRLIHCLMLDKGCRLRAKTKPNNIKLSILLVLSSISIVLLLR